MVLAGAKPYLHSAGRLGLPRGAGRSPKHTFILLASQAEHVVIALTEPYLHAAGRSGVPRNAGRSGYHMLLAGAYKPIVGRSKLFFQSK